MFGPGEAVALIEIGWARGWHHEVACLIVLGVLTMNLNIIKESKWIFNRIT